MRRRPLDRATKRLAILALLVVVSLAPSLALACTCMWAGPFTRVALQTDLVVLAEVRGYHRHGMDVVVLEVLRGREPRPVIRIWGDTGAACRPYVTGFVRGTRWVFAVRRSPEPEGHGYAISGCGEHWVEARGDQAIGRITVAEYGQRLEVVPLADLLIWVRSGGTTPLPASSDGATLLTPGDRGNVR
jgi:hypothetical protein